MRKNDLLIGAFVKYMPKEILSMFIVIVLGVVLIIGVIYIIHEYKPKDGPWKARDEAREAFVEARKALCETPEYKGYAEARKALAATPEYEDCVKARIAYEATCGEYIVDEEGRF